MSDHELRCARCRVVCGVQASPGPDFFCSLCSEFNALRSRCDALEAQAGALQERIEQKTARLNETAARAAVQYQALIGLHHWKMRDGSLCWCPAGKNEDEPKGRMPTVHSTACEETRAALSPDAGRDLLERLERAERIADEERALRTRTESDHLAERGRLVGLLCDLLGVIGDMRRRTYLLPDHACAECAPTSEILIVGFRCPIHEARARVDSMLLGDEAAARAALAPEAGNPTKNGEGHE